MSAATLRAAATKLREAATAAARVMPEKWVATGEELNSPAPGVNWSVGTCAGCGWDDPENADLALYVSTVSPSFGLAVADWLDAAANDGGRSGFALAVARSIVGGDE